MAWHKKAKGLITPLPYFKKDADGKQIGIDEQAKMTAEWLNKNGGKPQAPHTSKTTNKLNK